MKNKVLIGLCACVLFVAPLVSSAYFTDANITEELRSQIGSLLKQVAELQAKIAKMQGQQTTGWCHTFNADLRVGDRGSEVAALQSVLVKEGFSIPDNETPQKDGDTSYNNRFMEGTASAVSAFQEKYRSEILTPAGLKFPTGYLGARTRAKLNSLYGCGTIENNIELPVITGPSSNFSQATVGQYYSATFTVSPKYKNNTEILYGSWQVDNIVPGLSAKVNSPGTNSYTLYGTPTQAGTYTMTVKVKSVDGNYSASQIFTLTVSSNASQSLKVTSPNGGETFYLGGLVPITWTPAQNSSVSPVTVSLIDTSGNERFIGSTKNTVNQDYYAWSIPNCTAANTCSSNFQIAPGQYKMRIISPTSKDESDGYFTIASQVGTSNPNSPTINVNYPKAGEQWKAGETKEIKWQSTDAPAGSWVGRVALYKNNGAVFLIDLVPFLSQSSANGSTYYQVPLNSVTGDDFKIQVILYSGTPGNESTIASDWSDTFSIVSSPSSINIITSGLCPRISQVWGETFVDVDAGSIYMGGKSYVVNGSTGVTAGANKTVNFYAYVPSGQSTGYIGVADLNTPEASNFESMGVLVATVKSGANPTDSASFYGGIIQSIDSNLAKCPSYTRPVSTLNSGNDDD